jgi:hypothetical protein
MPFFVEPAVDVLAGGVGEGLDDCVVGVAAGVAELDELEPHAATPRAARAKSPAAQRRIVLDVLLVIFAPSVSDRKPDNHPIPMRRRTGGFRSRTTA